MAKKDEVSMRGLLIRPEMHPMEIWVERGLEPLQKLVHGLIDVAYPFEDNVGLILNDEGKFTEPLNRALYSPSGEVVDIICGDFVVLGLSEDDFQSLTEEQVKKYTQRFYHGELFIMGSNKQIMAIPIM